MNTELQSLNERIAEKVGKELVDLIPQEQWQKLVDSQIDKFMTDMAPQIIQEELKKLLTTAVSSKLGEAQFQGKWNQYSSQVTSEAIHTMIKEAAPEVFAAMLAPTMTGFLQDLRNRLNIY